MKNLIILAIIIFFSCNNNNTKHKHNSIEYKDTMKRTYFADFNFSGDFEIIINGISIKRNKLEGVSNGLEYLNPYISKSGQQNITLIVKPLTVNSQIQITDVKDYFIDIIYTDNGEAAPVYQVKRCSFPPINKPVDSLVYTWTFDAEVSYENNVLEDAKDLTKEDPENLLKEVLLSYEKVYNLINAGNVKEYMDMYEKSRKREMISMYYDNTKQKEYLSKLENRALSSKGFMLPLNNYKLLIHPNKKLVSLVDSQGKTPLYSVDNQERKKTYGLLLYRSLKTGKLEVY